MMSRSSSRPAVWPLTLRSGPVSAKVRPWHVDPSTASVVLINCPTLPPSPMIRVWLHEIRAHGFGAVRFGAVPDAMADLLERQGFEPVQRLTLLDMSLVGWRDSSSVRTRRLRTVDRGIAQQIDLAAFGAPWALDEAGIGESCDATPYHRARMVDAVRVDPTMPAGALGYAISGRADREGFLQRLAVRPEAQGCGVGTALVVDSLRWMKRHRVSRAVVNTHVENAAALRLYRRIGFRALPQGLVLLRRSLEDLP